jgi:hypothetical protein
MWLVIYMTFEPYSRKTTAILLHIRHVCAAFIVTCALHVASMWQQLSVLGGVVGVLCFVYPRTKATSSSWLLRRWRFLKSLKNLPKAK